MEDQVQRRLADFSDLQRPTVQRLQDTLFTSDLLIRELRSAGTEAENENMEYHIVIVEGRTPVAEHAHRYNRQLSTEVALLQVGSAEAAWRIFGFPITGRHPAVMTLSILLENGQRVTIMLKTPQELSTNSPQELF